MSDIELTLQTAAPEKPDDSFDVVIIGASAAGCAIAILFAQKGLNVALVEQRISLNAFKKVCTHYLQPELIPYFKKMGVWEGILEAGAVPSHMSVRTQWGVVNLPHLGEQRGMNLRREKLDPILRKKAASFSNIHLFSGYKLERLLTQNKRYSGVDIREVNGDVHRLRALLVVGADGRASQCARLSGVSESRVENERFSYFSFYKHLPERYQGDTQVWIMDEGESYISAFPNDSDLTLVGAYLANRHLPEWQGDIEAQYERYIRSLPDGPQIDRADRVSPIFGMKKGDSILRHAAVPGLALVGDAALAVDPLSGAGIMLAIKSAAMLADTLSSPLQTQDVSKVDRSLNRYRRKHKIRFGYTFWFHSRFSRAKSYHPLTKLLLWLAVKILGRPHKESFR